jgi:hypothetical protein
VAFWDFRFVNRLKREAWFCRKTSLKVEMVTGAAGAFSEFRGAASELETNFPVTSMIEYRLQKKNRKVVNDHVVNFANGYPQ